MTDHHKPRLLFCSYHSYLDHASGAALATRDLLELLVGAGWDCAAFSGPQLDDHRTTAEDALRKENVPFQFRPGSAHGSDCTVYHASLSGVAFHGFVPKRPPAPKDPAEPDGQAFLQLYDSILQRFRPDIVLTYGGHWIASPIIQKANQIGAKTVFALHNRDYTKKDLFAQVTAVFVPSKSAQEHYRQTLGIECAVLPGPWVWQRFLCAAVDGRYVTFVNPQPCKGAFCVARIVLELGNRRPDIPFLIVDSRGQAEWLAQGELDLSRLTNLKRMLNTPDPREFYKISRMLLVPSLWQEGHPRVAVEAIVNGIPVLASNRGGLPEVLAEAGLLLDLPARLFGSSLETPTAAEVKPWIEAIERLWDDPAYFERERQRCRAAAEAWKPERVIREFEAFFNQLRFIV